MEMEDLTLIREVNKIRRHARRVKRFLPPGKFDREHNYMRIGEQFEIFRRYFDIPLIDDVMHGKTSFHKEVSKYTRPKSRSYHPPLRKIDNDNLRQVETCVGNFYGDSTLNTISNPVGGTALGLGILGLTAEALYQSEKKKERMTRRKALKTLLFTPVFTLAGMVGSQNRIEDYRRAEHNAMVLDYCAQKLKELYPR